MSEPSKAACEAALRIAIATDKAAESGARRFLFEEYIAETTGRVQKAIDDVVRDQLDSLILDRDAWKALAEKRGEERDALRSKLDKMESDFQQNRGPG